jgi:PST family polysaccharide transporter
VDVSPAVDPIPVAATLSRVARRGGSVTVVGQIAKTALQLASMLVLARLLSPTAFGLVAMSTVFMGIGDLLRDFGLGTAAVQAKILTPAQKTNLFWCNAVLGVGLVGLALLLARPIADYYGEPDVAFVVITLAPGLLLNALQTQFLAELARDLRFLRIAVTDVVAQAAALVVAIGFAVSGAGIWTLIAQQLTTSGVLLVGRVLATRWRPGRPSRRAGLRPLFRYGYHLTTAQFLGYAASNADTLIIGSQFGSAALGGYSRAFQLLLTPLNQLLNPLTNVVLPVLARVTEGSDRYWEALRKVQWSIGVTLIPALAVAAALAGPVIGLLLGPGWEESVPVFAILAVGGVFQTFTFVGYWVFLSTGTTGPLVRYNLVTKTLTVAMVVLGSRWGVEGVAIGYAASMCCAWPICLWWLRRVVRMPVGDFFRGGAESLLLSAACSLTAAGVGRALSGEPLIVALVGGLAAAGGVYLVAAACWPPLRTPVRLALQWPGRLVARGLKRV